MKDILIKKRKNNNNDKKNTITQNRNKLNVF